MMNKITCAYGASCAYGAIFDDEICDDEICDAIYAHDEICAYDVFCACGENDVHQMVATVVVMTVVR
jgi:hypothetical protein